VAVVGERGVVGRRGEGQVGMVQWCWDTAVIICGGRWRWLFTSTG
jgi:hypothetical protein